MLASHNLEEHVRHGILRPHSHIPIPVFQKIYAGTQMASPLLGATLQIRTGAGRSAISPIVSHVYWNAFKKMTLKAKNTLGL